MKRHHRMIRGMRLGIAAGATALAMAGTATAAVAPAADAAVTTPSHPLASPIHKVRCTSKTFTVQYDGSRKACYEGTGVIVVRIPNLDRILTGVNYGFFRLTHNPRVFVTFHPRQTFVFSPTLRTELFSIDITRA